MKTFSRGRSKFVIRVIIVLAILSLVQAIALFHESYCTNVATVEFDSNIGIFNSSNLLFRLDNVEFFLFSFQWKISHFLIKKMNNNN